MNIAYTSSIVSSTADMYESSFSSRYTNVKIFYARFVENTNIHYFSFVHHLCTWFGSILSIKLVEKSSSFRISIPERRDRRVFCNNCFKLYHMNAITVGAAHIWWNISLQFFSTFESNYLWLFTGQTDVSVREKNHAKWRVRKNFYLTKNQTTKFTMKIAWQLYSTFNIAVAENIHFKKYNNKW